MSLTEAVIRATNACQGAKKSSLTTPNSNDLGPLLALHPLLTKAMKDALDAAPGDAHALPNAAHVGYESGHYFLCQAGGGYKEVTSILGERKNTSIESGQYLLCQGGG